MKHMLDLPTMEKRHKVATVKAFFRFARDKGHPLHGEIGKVKGNRIKRGRSWLARAEDLVSRVCELKDVQIRPDWVDVPQDIGKYSKVVIALGCECRDMDPSL